MVNFNQSGPTEKSGPPLKEDQLFWNFSGWTKTEPFSVRPKFLKSLVEWITPHMYIWPAQSVKSNLKKAVNIINIIDINII